MPDTGTADLGDITVYPRTTNQAWLGFSLTPGQSGAVVGKLANRRAYNGRINEGDIIVSIAGTKTAGLGVVGLHALLDDQRSPSVMVQPRRGGAPVAVKLPSRPGFGS